LQSGGLTKHSSKGIREFGDSIIRDVLDFQKPRAQFDDVTLLIVQVN